MGISNSTAPYLLDKSSVIAECWGLGGLETATTVSSTSAAVAIYTPITATIIYPCNSASFSCIFIHTFMAPEARMVYFHKDLPTFYRYNHLPHVRDMVIRIKLSLTGSFL